MSAVESWFSRRRMGLFLHFGLYAIEGWHEQDQMRRSIPRKDYAKLMDRFNPADFDPEEILDLAESVGMEYLCLTTKHHDGFCLWDTELTDFKVTNSPYGKDLLADLAASCHKRNFPLGLYYSVVDWRHPSYPNQGRHHELAGPEEGDVEDWGVYMDFLKGQVRELCFNYGEIRHFFWDMNVPEHSDPTVNEMIRSLQPRVVINNRGFDDGDFGTPERDYNQDEIGTRKFFAHPTEACNSVGSQSWGFRKDEGYYSSAYLINGIDEVMAKGGNYLLNVGPDAMGKIPPLAKDILADIGNWYGKVREAFSDTEPCTGLCGEHRLTRKGSTIYVHLPNPAISDSINLRPISVLPKRATLLNTGERLSFSDDVLPCFWRKQAKFLSVNGLPRDRVNGGENLIIRLEFDRLPEAENIEVEAFKG